MHDQLMVGPFSTGRVHHGDCMDLILSLPDASVDVVVTSPPYWGLRGGSLTRGALGAEEDPREYLRHVAQVFARLLPKLKPEGIAWLNIADCYNTPVNWTRDDSHRYSTLGPCRDGLTAANAAHDKPRAARKAFIAEDSAPWLTQSVRGLGSSGVACCGAAVYRVGVVPCYAGRPGAPRDTNFQK